MNMVDFLERKTRGERDARRYLPRKIVAFPAQMRTTPAANCPEYPDLRALPSPEAVSIIPAARSQQSQFFQIDIRQGILVIGKVVRIALRRGNREIRGHPR
jgi:hypothetical protein